jgi:hypothetical protein
MAEPSDTGGVDTERESLLSVLARHDVEFVLITRCRRGD